VLVKDKHIAVQSGLMLASKHIIIIQEKSRL
jgi:hypothetical protein